jgi:signal transduction histidine kinase
VQSNDAKAIKLPWWTWIVPLLVFHLGSEISILFRYTQGVGAIYLPTAFGIIFIHWWGWKRTLPALYLNGLLSTPLWGITTWYFWPLYAVPETLAILLSYYLFSKLSKGKYWLPDTSHTIRFIFLAIVVPFIVDLLLLQSILVITGEQPMNLYLAQFLRNLLGEVTTNFGICMVVLFYFSGFMKKRNWLMTEPTDTLPSIVEMNPNKKIELVVIFLVLFFFSLIIPFDQYWFLYGIASLYVSIRYGFGETLICNLFLFLITYILPAFISNIKEEIIQENYLFNVFLGNLMLYIFAALTGRIISDLKSVENKLFLQNQELDQTNQELDRFVYSVSHDLSAPLKSIRGLVMISQLDRSASNKEDYLDKINQSALKLDSFIKEILDYSRNKRMTIQKEKIELADLCVEILENLKYTDNFGSIRFDLDEIKRAVIITDRLRLKMILTNLFSNSIKFQKQRSGEPSFIKVSIKKEGKNQQILVEDNGDGIQKEFQAKIFDMFYRARSDSNGSGLGLYIAQEAAEKIEGRIFVESEFGKGSLFILELPRNF